MFTSFIAILPLYFFLAFYSLQTSLLCIAGELAGGGSVAVAVGRLQVTRDT